MPELISMVSSVQSVTLPAKSVSVERRQIVHPVLWATRCVRTVSAARYALLPSSSKTRLARTATRPVSLVEGHQAIVFPAQLGFS